MCVLVLYGTYKQKQYKVLGSSGLAARSDPPVIPLRSPGVSWTPLVPSSPSWCLVGPAVA
jgi:hypothetical protein